MDNPLDTFVSQLLTSSGQEDDPKQHEALLEEVNNAVDQALLEALPQAQLAKLEQATVDNTATEEMISQLITESKIDTDKILENTLRDFSDNYLKGGER